MCQANGGEENIKEKKGGNLTRGGDLSKYSKRGKKEQKRAEGPKGGRKNGKEKGEATVVNVKDRRE